MIELYLSSDGKHTVHAKADTPSQMDELAPYTRALYEAVTEQFGTKAQMWGSVMNGQSNGQAKRKGENGKANGQMQFGRRVDTVEQAQEAVAPRCPDHDVPMAYRVGRYGPFYSCKVRENGEWCNHTQQVPRTKKLQDVPSLHAQV